MWIRQQNTSPTWHLQRIRHTTNNWTQMQALYEGGDWGREAITPELTFQKSSSGLILSGGIDPSKLGIIFFWYFYGVSTLAFSFFFYSLLMLDAQASIDAFSSESLWQLHWSQHDVIPVGQSMPNCVFLYAHQNFSHCRTCLDFLRWHPCRCDTENLN